MHIFAVKQKTSSSSSQLCSLSESQREKKTTEKLYTGLVRWKRAGQRGALLYINNTTERKTTASGDNSADKPRELPNSCLRHFTTRVSVVYSRSIPAPREKDSRRPRLVWSFWKPFAFVNAGCVDNSLRCIAVRESLRFPLPINTSYLVALRRTDRKLPA